VKKFTKKDFLVFGCCGIIACFAIIYNEQIKAENAVYFPRPLSDDDLKKYSNTDLNAIVIYDIFTQKAYDKNGFYDYYNKTCSTCTTVSIADLKLSPNYTSSISSLTYLSQLHYPFITDIDVDKNPGILNKYDKIILLHNEYVTKTEFDAIKNHKNVIYLYPNSLYAEVSVDYKNLTMSLVRGHGYPDKDLLNGFGYVTSSNNEYDLNCKHFKWEQMPNGMQLSCWPEFLIKSDRSVLQTIKDYPDKVPTLVLPETHLLNGSHIPVCDYNGNCK